MKIKTASFLLLVLIINVACSNQPEIKSIDNYFGKIAAADSAVAFAPGTISTLHHEHSRITFSKTGYEMFWAVIPVDTSYKSTGRSPFKLEKQNIWFSKLINNRWSDPEIFEITKNTDSSSPAFSADGNLFYYRSIRPDSDPDIRPIPTQLWKVIYSDSNWGEPEKEYNLIPVVENKAFMSFCFADNGNLYFDFGGPDSTGEWWWDIYLSEYDDGVYLAPVKMGNGINDGEASWCPWIAPDESYIIYSSHREGEFGHGDLYINFRNDDNNWSEPINMGPKVNSPKQERFPSVSPDGKYLFFARHMPETFSDIFWINTDIIEQLNLYD